MPSFPFNFSCALMILFFMMPALHSQLTIPSPPSSSDLPDYASPYVYCYAIRNDSSNSAYDQNLNAVLNDLGTDPPSPSNLFKVKTRGSGLDIAYGWGQCFFSSLSSTDCSNCVKNAANLTTILCPSAVGATIVFEECLVGYADQNRSADSRILSNHLSVIDASSLQNIQKVVSALRNDVPGSNKPIAVESGDDSANWFFGFAECHNLSATDCLERFKNLPPNAPVDTRVIFTNFFFRYEHASFFTGGVPFRKLATKGLAGDGSIPASSPNIHVPPKGSSSHIFVIILSTTIGGGTLLGVWIFWMICLRRKRPKCGRYHREHDLVKTKLHKGCQMFSYEVLKEATKNFSQENRLGKGGFGIVYKGLLYDGTEVAVKHLSSTSKQGNSEFLTEVAIVTSIQHKNLVKLKGCCIEGEERLLVYEYLEHKSLNLSLFGTHVLNWETRYNIALGIARGLAYLHEECEPRILHRDIKASNVLLDVDFQPKIADFGLARLFPDGESFFATTRPAGTMGYISPEALRGHISNKSDVFSFGVLLLEIISGRGHIHIGTESDIYHIIDWTSKICKERSPLEVIDPRLEGIYSEHQALGLIHIATLCVQTECSRRPKMSNVVKMIMDYNDDQPSYMNDQFSMSLFDQNEYLEFKVSSSMALSCISTN